MNARAPSCALAIEDIERWSAGMVLDFRHDVLSGMGAIYSPCARYRYLIWRIWNPHVRFLGFGMLNPSTAGHDSDDATITRCMKRGHAMSLDGIGGIIGWNLFALRATDPKVMLRHTDPVGPHNGEAMMQAIRHSAMTIAAWGTHGTHLGRDRAVLNLLDACNEELFVLGLTKDGHPRHPLYVASHVQPWVWERGA